MALEAGTDATEPASLEEIEDYVRSMSPAEKEALARDLANAPSIGPQEGPQTEAWATPAYITGYGGAAGGGKSALLALLVLLEHTRSVLFRADSVQMAALVDDLEHFYGSSAGLNRQNGWFRFQDRPQHLVEWGGIGKPGAEAAWKGRAHDLIGFDEVTEISEFKFRYLLTWCRTAIPGQRCRVVVTFNPPGPGDPGWWVVEFFGPWLLKDHPNPAAPGELRWYVKDATGKIDLEASGPGDVREYKMADGSMVPHYPQSRTFIPARAGDNAYIQEGYMQALSALPEPVKSQMMLGLIIEGMQDDAMQVIPTVWVDEAMTRWRENYRGDEALDDFGAMTAMGVDVGMGEDSTVLARRHGVVWQEMVVHQGQYTPDSAAVAAKVVEKLRAPAWACIDSNGIGKGPTDYLKSLTDYVKPIYGQGKPAMMGLESPLRFANRRSELWWSLRKVLDPARGLMPMLPPDTQLKRELTTPRYEVRPGQVIQMDPKSKIKEVLGYSPDRADALAYSMATLPQEKALYERVRSNGEAARREGFGMSPLAVPGGKRVWAPGRGSASAGSWMSG